MTLRNVLLVAVGLEFAVAATVVARRLNSTSPTPPLVDQYNDALTAAELRAMPDRFLFDSAVKWRTLADSYAAFGYYAKADACFLQAAAADPQSSEIAYHHGYCLLRLGRLEESLTEFFRVIDLNDPRFSSRAWYHVGGIHLRQEQPAEALQAFERASDDHLPSVYQRAKLLLRTGRMSDVAPLLDRLSEALPRDVHVWRLRLQVATETGQQEELIRARDALEQADLFLELDDKEEIFGPIRVRFTMDREIESARKLSQSGNAAAAAGRFARLVGPETHWDNVYLTLLQDAAQMQLEAGNATATRELIVRQIEIEQFPTATARRLRGAVEFIGRNWVHAFEAWSRAERMRPDSIDHVKMATVVEHLGDIQGARRHLALAAFYSGRDLFREGKLSEARTVLRQSIARDAELGEPWFYLAECERLSGDVRQAQATYRRCMEMCPTHGRAAARLRELEQNH